MAVPNAVSNLKPETFQTQVTQGEGEPLDGNPMAAGGYPDHAAVPEDIEPLLPPRPASSDATPYIDALPPEFKIGKKPDEQKIAALAQNIWGCIIHAKADREGILPRIARNESLVKNRPRTAVGKKPFPKAQAHHIPITGPKLDQRMAQLISTLFTPDQFYNLVKLGESEKAKELSEFLQWNIDNARFEDALIDVADLCKYCAPAMLQVDFTTSPAGNENSNVVGPYAGLTHRVIHPEFFLVHPANTPSLLDAAFAGHEFELRVADVKMKQRKKIYSQTAAVTAAPTAMRINRKNQGLQRDSGANTIENNMVRLYDALVRWCPDADKDPMEKVYRVIGDVFSQTIYRIEEYTCPYPNYIPFRLKRDLNAFLSEDSPANDGQSIQLMINDVGNTIKWALEYSTRPTVMTQNQSGQDSVKEIAPGTEIPTQDPAAAQQLSTSFNFAGLFDYFNILLQAADMALKVPNTVSGAPAPGEKETATAEQIKAQGFQLMGGGDIKMWLPSLHQYAKLALWILADNFADVWQTYGGLGVFEVDDVRHLRMPVQVFVAGQKPAMLPTVQMQEIQQLFSLAQLFPEMQSELFELLIMYIGQTSIDGKEEIVSNLKKVKEQEEQLAAAAQQAQEESQRTGQPITDPTILSYLDQQSTRQMQGMRELITMAYKDMPPDVQRQAEKMFGFKPSQMAPAQAPDMTNKGLPS